MKATKAALTAIIAASLFGSGDVARAQTYNVIDLSTFGGPTSYATGVNDRGQVCGGGANVGGLFLSGACGGGLKEIRFNAQYFDERATCVNNRGDVVGEHLDDAKNLFLGFVTDANAYHTYDLTVNASTLVERDIGPTGINDAGQICGSYIIPSANFLGAFYLASSTSPVKDLGSLGGGSSGACAINKRGQVAGTSRTLANVQHAFISGPNGGPLVDVTPAARFSFAMGINNFGQVAGEIQAGNSFHAFFTERDTGAIHDLGSFEGTMSWASGINDRGDVVGSEELTNSVNGFLYHNGRMNNLNNMIGRHPNYTIWTVAGISNTGFIAAQGMYKNGKEHALLLIPQATDLARPTHLVALPHDRSVELHWNRSVGAQSYVIYRALSPTGIGIQPLDAGITSTSYVDSGRKNGVTYYYKVAAEDASGVSGQSDSAGATPALP